MKMVYAKQDKNEKIKNETANEDITCTGETKPGQPPVCQVGSWSNPEWKNGKIPDLNLKNPPRKDTLIISPGRYAVVSIKSDKPGKWFIHCHVEFDAIGGMAVVMAEGMDKAPKKPPDFPQCWEYNKCKYQGSIMDKSMHR